MEGLAALAATVIFVALLGMLVEGISQFLNWKDR